VQTPAPPIGLAESARYGGAAPNNRRALKDTAMTVSMYSVSAPIFVQFLTALSAVLGKAEQHAEAKKIEPAALLSMRLYPDMFPLHVQVRQAVSHAANACGHLAGAALPQLAQADHSFADLQARVRAGIDFVKSLKADQIDGTENKDIKLTFPSGATREFKGQGFLLNHCLPNFYFHTTTAYDILRHAGVEIGKRDFMGTPVQL
jgi:hypothetical protein